jgi:DNA-binding protein YbaB
MTTPFEQAKNLAAEAENASDKLAYFKLMRDQTQAISDLIGEIYAKTYPGTDENSAVEVEIDGYGAISSLKVTPLGMRNSDHSALGEAVIAAVQSAQLNMLEGLRQDMKDKMGVDLPDEPPTSFEEILGLSNRWKPPAGS